MQDFSALPKTLSKALSLKGFGGLTPVQVAVSDEALAGKDLLVSAQTGSGKTVGFGLAMAEELLDQHGRFDRSSGAIGRDYRTHARTGHASSTRVRLAVC